MNAKSMTNYLPTFNMILFKNLRPSLSLSLPSRQDMRILVLTAANKIRKGKAIFFLNNVGNRFTIPYYSIFYIADESFHVLHDINLNIEQGEFVGIMGKSGSGKFALINIIGFLDDQFEERYDFYEHPIHDYRRAQFSKCGRIKLWEII